jgi:hypothetical protein
MNAFEHTTINYQLLYQKILIITGVVSIIQDRESAETFVENISLSEELLRSQAIYDSTHPKLIDSVLKSKYTIFRNRILE